MTATTRPAEAPVAGGPGGGGLESWAALALDLPRFHAALGDGDATGLAARIDGLPPIDAAELAALATSAARMAALDVLMVDACVQRHAVPLAPGPRAVLDGAVAAVAARLGIPPILSYPLYIRDNPMDLDAIRRFTPLDGEFRFIRMHRLIEDTFDRLILRLGSVIQAHDRRAALAAAMPAITADFQLVNRTMSAFRSPTRMPHDEFALGFRPYFGSRLDPATGQVILDGPSGLQSPTYRIIAMQIGYRDAVMDGWTERIARYHDPETRAELARARAARDAGHGVAAACDAVLGAHDLPRLHPAYRAHIPLLLDVALRNGYVGDDVETTFERFALALGEWPAEAPADGAVAPVPLPALADADRADLAHLVHLEAMLFGFHLEHVATTAVQIGALKGTGGTSGVEFLLIATFRRAFPALWVSGAAEALIRDGWA